MLDSPWTSFPVEGVAVVFGAGGGIGSAMVSRMLAYNCFERVVSFNRTSKPAIDLLDELSLRDAAAFAAAQGAMRVVVDATGFSA